MIGISRLSAGLKMERGWVADQPQHMAIAKTPEHSRPAAADRGRPSRAPGFSDTLLFIFHLRWPHRGQGRKNRLLHGGIGEVAQVSALLKNG